MGVAHSLFQSAAFLRWIFPRDDDLPRLLLFFQLSFKLGQPDEIRQRHLAVLQIQPLFNIDEQLADSLPPGSFEPPAWLYFQRLFDLCSACRHLNLKKMGAPFPEAPASNSLLH